MSKEEVLVKPRGIDDRDFYWGFWFVAPLYPYGKRQTLRREIVKDTIWTFEQIQGILYVVVPIRMTVVKLEGGGLLVYAPVAPTSECIRLVRELEAEHGEVKYIILPTISGIEHKVFVGPFARRFPQALVFIAPHQWSFPLDLPLSWLGLPPKRTKILTQERDSVPFASEFDWEILGPIDLRLGQFEEVALFHKRSRALLLTDTLVSIPETPPEVVQLDPYPLLFHARDSAVEPMRDTWENRVRGWQRIALFSLYFKASVLDTPSWSDTFRRALMSPERSAKAYFGLYPFQWRFDWKKSFDALRGSGRPFVAPILQATILNRAPEETLAWRDRVAKWDFTQIIPCHFEPLIYSNPQQFREAFSFLEGKSGNAALPEGDLELIRQISNNLEKVKIIPASKS